MKRSDLIGLMYRDGAMSVHKRFQHSFKTHGNFTRYFMFSIIAQQLHKKVEWDKEKDAMPASTFRMTELTTIYSFIADKDKQADHQGGIKKDSRKWDNNFNCFFNYLLITFHNTNEYLHKWT